jgi:hypothetical protein
MNAFFVARCLICEVVWPTVSREDLRLTSHPRIIGTRSENCLGSLQTVDPKGYGENGEERFAPPPLDLLKARRHLEAQTSGQTVQAWRALGEDYPSVLYPKATCAAFDVLAPWDVVLGRRRPVYEGQSGDVTVEEAWALAIKVTAAVFEEMRG